MNRRRLAMSVALAAGASWYLLLPARPVVLPPDAAGGPPPVRGAIHVHTRRSDGTGTVDDVAAAARRAGLQFVIITDHGDGTRGQDTPVYRAGVLCIDGVEISSNDGHIVALDLPQAPYPLGGEVGDVLEDIRRMGGMSIAAHPDSMRPELRLTGWTGAFDGVEWLNGDSQWRDESWLALARALFSYPFRRAATLGTLLDRPDDLLNRWDALLRRRPVVALAAADAHARVGPGADPYGRSLSLHIPGYEQVFRTFSISLPGVRLGGEARDDARTVLDAIRRGRTYSSIDALARPAMLAFEASSGAQRAEMGDRLVLEGPVVLKVRVNAPDGSTVRLLSDGKVIASGAPPGLDHSAPSAPGAYRVEVDVPGAPGTPPVPWIVSNPIYAGAFPDSDTSSKPAPVSETVALYTNGPARDWRIEKSVRSEATLDVAPSVGGTQLLLRYGLGGVRSESPFVAAVVPARSDLSRFDRITFTARAMHPMRLTFQLRATGDGDRRWGRSVYLDGTARTITLAFDDMSPLGTATGRPVLGEVRDLLFVVDTVHARQGSSGQVWLDDVSYVR
jgi:hypothetical protein